MAHDPEGHGGEHEAEAAHAETASHAESPAVAMHAAPPHVESPHAIPKAEAHAPEALQSHGAVPQSHGVGVASRTKFSERPILGIVPRFFGRLWGGAKELFGGTVVEPISGILQAGKHTLKGVTTVPAKSFITEVGKGALIDTAIMGTASQLGSGVKKVWTGVREAVKSVGYTSWRELFRWRNPLKNVGLAIKALLYDPAKALLKTSLYEGVVKESVIGVPKKLLHAGVKTVNGTVTSVREGVSEVFKGVPAVFDAGAKAAARTLEGVEQIVTAPLGGPSAA